MKNTIPHMLSIAAFTAAVAVGFVARAQQSPPARGLDSLDERDVYTNLIKYKLTDLAKYDMSRHNVSAAEQEQVLSLASLMQLKTDNNLSAAQRRAVAVSAANGLQGILPKTDDVKTLNEDADILCNFGVKMMVDNLDYYGPNPDAQKQLLPVAQTTKEAYAKASHILDTQINALNNKINNNNMAQIMNQARGLVNQQLLIDYTNNMTSYAVCIALPPGDPKVAKTANDAIDYLKQFDNPDSGVQAEVKLATGKLDMAKGDYAAAKAMFDPLIDGGAKIKPPVTPGQQYLARYFSVVCELDAKDLKKADTDADDVSNWVRNNLHLDEGDMNAVAASAAMLHFRVYSAESDAAGATTSVGKGFNDKAITTLVKLLQDHPGNRTLEDLVFDQIRGRIGPNPDYKSLDTLALLAIQSEGFNQYGTKDTKPVDPVVMEKAIAASRELVNRKGQAGIDQAKAEQSSRFVAFAYQFALHKDFEAASAYLDYLTDFKANPKTSEIVAGALANCESIFHDLHAKQTDKQTTAEENEKINALFDRFLPLAIAPPYNEKQLAYMYGKALFDKKQWADAATYLGMVEPTDKRIAVASYLRMVALNNLLTDPVTKLPADQRKEVATQTVEAAQKAAKLNLAAAAAATVDPKEKPFDIERAIAARIVASDAELTELKDPAASLKEIDGIEQTAAPLEEDRQKAVHISAVRQRCSIYLSSDDTDKAVAANLDLLKIDQPAGQRLLFEVNAAIDRDLNTAVAAKDNARVKQLTVARAELTGKIVEFVANDPKLKESLPAYQLYDAQSKQAAAELLDEGPARTQALQGALAQYNNLLKGFNAGDLTAQLDAVKAEVARAKDPKPPALLAKQSDLETKISQNEQAECGAGLVSFDLGDYQRCIDLLSPLIGLRHVGEPVMKDADGKDVENARYWEIYYKFYQSLVNVAEKDKKNPKSADMIATVKGKVANEYLFYKDAIGGSRWHDQWMELLKHLKS